MSGLLQFLPTLALGLSLVLGAGAIAVAVAQTPLMRHRLADLCLTGCLLSTVLLCVPLRRPLAGVLQETGLAAQPALSIPAGTLPLRAAATEPAGASAPPARQQPRQPNSHFGLRHLWLLGAGCACLRLVASFVILGRTVRRARPAPLGVQRLLPATGRRPRILHSDAIQRPLCCGARPGIILLPSSLLDPARADQLHAVLLHEHAHLTMGHGLARFQAACVAPLLFWNPLYWLHVAVLRKHAELLADEAAGQVFGTHNYVSALLQWAQSQAHRPRAERRSPTPALGIFGSSEPFYQRMSLLLKRDQPLATRCSPRQQTVTRVALASCLALVGCALGSAPAPAHPRPLEFQSEGLSDLAARVRAMNAQGTSPTSLVATRNSQGGFDVLLTHDDDRR